MTSLFDLSGARALVTGGTSGIGLAMAIALSEAGAAVAVWGRTASKLDRVASEHGFATYLVDVADEGAVVAATAQVAADLGGLDTVVVGAGLNHPIGKLVASTTTDYRTALEANLDGSYWTLREPARVLVAQAEAGRPGGSIILIASLAGVQGAAGNQAYAVAKAGVLALMKGSAVELARHGIRVNAVLPGWIATDMTTEVQVSAVFEQKVISRVPLRRWGLPEEIAGIGVYLASRAASYHTGDMIVIDGGYQVF